MRSPGTFRGLRSRRFDLRALGQDLPLKAVAVGVALILYVTVAQAAVREQIVEFDGRIPVSRPDIPEGHVLRGQLGEVTVRIRGTPAALSAVTREHIRATIELSLAPVARGEMQEARVQATVLAEGVKVVDTAPATIPVRLERLTSRTLAVQTRFANEPPRGFVPGNAVVAPAEVAVSGPESAVAAVAAVFATVRFGDVGVDITQGAEATAVDQAGVAVEGVKVEPAGVQVRVPLLPTSTTRTLPVIWSLRGAVAAGHWISRVTTDPVAVTIRGAPEAISGLEHIETAGVDVRGLTASRTVTVALQLPAGVALLEPVTATVTVTVIPLSGTRPFPMVAVRAQGLAPNQTAEVQPGTVEVVLSGPLTALQAVTAEQVTAIVDAAGRAAGAHQLEVVVRAPAGLRVESVQPQRVTVTISTR